MIKFLSKKNIFILFTIHYSLFTILLMPSISFAATCDSPVCSIADVLKILNNIATWMYTIFFTVAVIFILIAAFNFLFAQGNPEKVTTARKQVTYAVIAIIIALVAASATYLIKNILEGKFQ